MIEELVRNYLRDNLDVPVLLEHPEGEDPQSFVVIERTGGSKHNLIKTSVMVVQSYGASLFEAASLNEKVKEKMETLVESSKVSKVSLNSDYNYTDKTTKRYRYQAVFEITHY